ncbi:hypothetical protein LPJ70_000208 [Coemansia sp. RSA 2708]|nr:hypothetical protein LPJ70_000208 [Coemansia sp. RSA 2708]
METVGNNTLVYQYTLGNEYPPPMIEYEPVRWIAYLMSVVFPLLAVRMLMVGRAMRAPWLCVGALAPSLMFLALVLRGAMGSESDAFRMYEAQAVLYLSAGVVLTAMHLVVAAKWQVRAKRARPSVVGRFLTHAALAYALAGVACVSAGVPLSFDSSEARRVGGYRLVAAALAVTLGMVVLGAGLAAYHTDRRGAAQVAIVAAPAVLLAAWASYALACTSLPMHSTANASDALFYCLGVLPAAGAAGVWAGAAEDALGAGQACCAACPRCLREVRVQQAMGAYA